MVSVPLIFALSLLALIITVQCTTLTSTLNLNVHDDVDDMSSAGAVSFFVDFTGATQLLKRPWQECVGSGHASLGLRFFGVVFAFFVLTRCPVHVFAFSRNTHAIADKTIVNRWHVVTLNLDSNV